MIHTMFAGGVLESSGRRSDRARERSLGAGLLCAQLQRGLGPQIGGLPGRNGGRRGGCHGQRQAGYVQ